jgi:hypothetical protein
MGHFKNPSFNTPLCAGFFFAEEMTWDDQVSEKSSGNTPAD